MCALILERYLWPPYVVGGAIIFLPCSFFLSIFYLLLSFFPHGVALVRI